MTKKTYFFGIQAFTLIELMVVVGIIAILATIGFSVYSNAQKIARDGKRIGDLQEIQKALEQYYAATNSVYPAALTSVNSYFQNGAAPTDPTSGANYTYVPCTTEYKYTLCTTGTSMESCTPTKCNATGAGSGCTPFPTPASGVAGTMYCVRSVSN